MPPEELCRQGPVVVDVLKGASDLGFGVCTGSGGMALEFGIAWYPSTHVCNKGALFGVA